jgi:outer membrane protein assembly factor BamB
VRVSDKRGALTAAALALILCAGCQVEPQASTGPAPDIELTGTPWPRFAGQTQDFKAPDPGVPTDWPRGGPRELWSRKLGPGYSGIVVEGDRLYTMYRVGNEEVVPCLDARTGENVWEYWYDGSPAEGHDSDYGDGPNSTPLLAGGRLYTIGVAGTLHALDAGDGTPIWFRELWDDLDGTFHELGYSPSPIPYGDTIIALVGGRDRGAVAFDKDDGSVVWQGLSLDSSYATPTIMKLAGEDHLVAFMATEVVGADPRTGELRWRYAIRNHYPQNICQPIPLGDDMLFVSTGEAGSRGLRVVQDEGWSVEEVWSLQRFQCFYGSLVPLGDRLYGPSGYQTAPLIAAIDVRTGELAWRERGFTLANLIGIGERLLILDDEGTLALATPGPNGLEVHDRARVLSEPARTPPTVVGRVVYVRDQKKIVALDLGRAAEDS